MFCLLASSENDSERWHPCGVVVEEEQRVIIMLIPARNQRLNDFPSSSVAKREFFESQNEKKVGEVVQM